MRCYNGAWDSEAAALFKEQDRLMAQIKKKEPEAHCTYFTPGSFVVHVWGREIGSHRDTRIGALQSAILELRKDHEESKT